MAKRPSTSREENKDALRYIEDGRRLCSPRSGVTIALPSALEISIFVNSSTLSPLLYSPYCSFLSVSSTPTLQTLPASALGN